MNLSFVSLGTAIRVPKTRKAKGIFFPKNPMNLSTVWQILCKIRIFANMKQQHFQILKKPNCRKIAKKGERSGSPLNTSTKSASFRHQCLMFSTSVPTNFLT